MMRLAIIVKIVWKKKKKISNKLKCCVSCRLHFEWLNCNLDSKTSIQIPKQKTKRWKFVGKESLTNVQIIASNLWETYM